VAEGIQIRLTSTGASASNILLDDIRSENAGGRRGLAPEYIYIPAPTFAVPTPSITLTYGGNVPMSFERGDIRGYINRGLITADFVVGTPVLAGIGEFTGDAGTGGVHGLVPAPAAGDTALNKFLKADGNWSTLPGTDFAQTISVAKSGGDYTTLEAGLAAAALVATTGNRIGIIMYPGDYTENNPLAVPDYVSIIAVGLHEVTRMLCANTGAGQHGLVLGSDTEVFGLQVRGCSGAGAAGFYFPVGLEDSELHDTKTSGCDIGYLSEAGGGVNPGILLRDPHITGGAGTAMFKVEAGGRMHVFGAVIRDAVTLTHWIQADGAGSQISIYGADARLAGTTNAVFVENTAIVRLSACRLEGPANGIVVAASGGTVTVSASIFSSVTWDLLLANSALVQVSIMASILDSTKFSVGALAALSGSFQSDDPLLPGPTTFGEMWLGMTVSSERLPLIAYAHDVFFTGLISGGTASDGGGLDIDVAPGAGYINTGNGVAHVTWAADTVTATADSDFYVYVTSGGVVSIATSQPSPETNITLAAGRAGPAALLFLTPDVVRITHPSLLVHEWIMDNAGALWLSGLDVTNAALVLSVGSGQYSNPWGQITVTGAAPATLLRWYRDPVAGWKTTTGNVDDGFYDDGSGVLAALGGDWKKDSLYVSTNGGVATFHYVYSQAKYIDQATAEAASLPVPPAIFQVSDLVLPLAGLVVDDAAADVTTILDERPTLGVSGSGSGAAAVDHGSLAGLGDDDHARYVTLTGNAARNAFSGTLAAAGGTVILPTSAAPAQTVAGSAVWDTVVKVLTVGDGTARVELVDTSTSQTLTNKTLSDPTFPTTVQFTPIAAPAYAEGQVYYDSTDKTLAVDVALGTRLQIGQEVHLRALNTSGAQINDGEVVYVSGASGVRPEVALADASAQVTATGVIGLATQDIANGIEGYVTTSGLVRDIDTTGGGEAWAPGDLLYLSNTVPGGMTNVPVLSPNYLIKVGWVLSAHATDGVVLVQVDTGRHFAELHDVLITAPIEAHVLAYDAGTGLWKNGIVVQATEILRGALEIATQAEVTAGADDVRAVTPLKLGVALGQTAFTEVTADTTTTATVGSPTNLLTINITPKDAAHFFTVHFTASGENINTGDEQVVFAVYYGLTGGQTRRRSTYIFSDNTGNESSGCTIVQRFAALGAGQHTVEIRWGTTGSTARIRPVANPNYDHAALLVQETSY